MIRERMGPGGHRGLQIRWPRPFGPGGGFDSLSLPPPHAHRKRVTWVIVGCPIGAPNRGSGGAELISALVKTVTWTWAKAKHSSGIWDAVVDVVTFVWLGVFAADVLVPLGIVPDLLLLSVLPLTVADLAVQYRRVGNLKRFVKKHWLTILMTIPYLRVLRLLRLVRLLRMLRLLRVGRVWSMARHSESGAGPAQSDKGGASDTLVRGPVISTGRVA